MRKKYNQGTKLKEIKKNIKEDKKRKVKLGIATVGPDGSFRPKKPKKMMGGGSVNRKMYASGTQEKNFSKLPEKIQKKINPKLAKKV